jgi:tetratricopeptide (TPR) repeat protein
LRALGAVERLIDAGKADEALRAAEALAKAASTDPMALEMLGRARIAASRPAAEVADAYANAAALSPDSPGLHGAAGMMAAQAGRKEQALRLLRRAEQLEPGNPQHALMQARVLVETGDAPSALAAAERARALSPLDTTVLLCVARCRIATGDMDSAGSRPWPRCPRCTRRAPRPPPCCCRRTARRRLEAWSPAPPKAPTHPRRCSNRWLVARPPTVPTARPPPCGSAWPPRQAAHGSLACWRRAA